MTELFERIVLPVASVDDARASARAIESYDVESIVAIHVIEKAGGAPDKASVDQREGVAQEAFEVLRAQLGPDIETDIRYETDVAKAVFAATEEYDATAIVITPRGGNRWVQLLTGDIALNIITETDRPVVVLPDIEPPDETKTESR